MASYDEIYGKLKRDPLEMQRKIAAVVRVNHDDVLTSMLRQAQTFMEWSYLQVLAEMDAKRAKNYLEETVLPLCRAKADQTLRELDEKSTVERRRDLAVNEPDYKTAQGHYLDSQQRALIFKSVVEALRQKKDMLQSLNSRQKVELDSLPHDRLPPEDWGDSGLHEEPTDGPTVDSHNGGRPLTEAELRSRIRSGREVFRMKRKERLTRTSTENSDNG